MSFPTTAVLTVSLESNLDNIMPKKTEKTSTPRMFLLCHSDAVDRVQKRTPDIVAAASTMLGGHIFKKTSASTVVNPTCSRPSRMTGQNLE